MVTALKTKSTKTKTRARKPEPASYTIAAVAPNQLPTVIPVGPPMVLPSCAPTVTSDAMVDYAVNEYEKECQKHIDEARQVVAKSQGELQRAAVALKKTLDVVEAELHDAFKAKARDAVEGLGFKFTADLVEATLAQLSRTRGRMTYRFGKSSYGNDKLTSTEEVELPEPCRAAADVVVEKRKAAEKANRVYLHWQNKMDSADRVRRDFRSRMTKITLSKLKGGDEMLANLMRGFSENYLAGPAEDAAE